MFPLPPPNCQSGSLPLPKAFGLIESPYPLSR
mgnify:CR=1 FL=1